MAKQAVLKIYGDIGESDPMMEMFGMSDSCISAKDVSEFLDENKDAKEILVKINSRGGDVQEGWAINDLLTTSSKKITTVGEGKVYSIATIIFLAGSTRQMLKNADGLIHNPYIPPYTLADKYESDDLTKIAEGLQQEEAKILDYYVERTGAEKSKLAEYMSEDTKLSAEDMLSLGFATEIVEPVMAFAYLKPKNTFNMNPKEEAKFMEKVGNKITEVISALGLSRIEEKNLTLTDTDGNELTIEKEEGEPVVGDKASPDGTFVLESGKTIVVTDGEIAEITEAEVEPTDKEELDKANTKIADLEKEIVDLKAAADVKSEAENALEAEKEKAVALVQDLQAMKNSWKPEGRTNDKKMGKVDGIDLDRVKEIQELNKTK